MGFSKKSGVTQLKEKLAMSDECDLLLSNAIVLTMDEELHTYEPGAVAIQGDHILAVGQESDLVSRFMATRDD